MNEVCVLGMCPTPRTVVTHVEPRFQDDLDLLDQPQAIDVHAVLAAEIDGILDDYRAVLGADFPAYRNHCVRVALYCRAFAREESLRKIAITAVFHDLGVWADQTWDYLEPSANRAQKYIFAHGADAWSADIDQAILNHHKITHCSGFAEAFRRADWIDLTFGFLHFGLNRGYIASVRMDYPLLGLHGVLLRRARMGWLANPLRPAPMMRW